MLFTITYGILAFSLTNITSNQPHAFVVAQRGFPEPLVRPWAYPSSPNRGGTMDMGSRLTVCHQRRTKPREHENNPDRGQVGEG